MGGPTPPQMSGINTRHLIPDSVKSFQAKSPVFHVYCETILIPEQAASFTASPSSSLNFNTLKLIHAGLRVQPSGGLVAEGGPTLGPASVESRAGPGRGRGPGPGRVGGGERARAGPGRGIAIPYMFTLRL